MHKKIIDEEKVQLVLDKLKDVARKGAKNGYVFYEEAGSWINLDMSKIEDRNELQIFLEQFQNANTMRGDHAFLQ